MGLKTLVEKCWYANSPKVLIALAPLEYLFKKLSSRRKAKHSMRAPRAPKPVIIVGNIVVGGTGKTPVIIALARLLIAQGIRPGIISRGYGRTSEALHIVGPKSTPALAGDEPLEIYQATKCPIVVSEDRNFAVEVLVKSADIDIVLSDDGLQHYNLTRQMEIAVFNQFHGAGNGHCLPVGPLRESVSRLHSVNFVLINQSPPDHSSLRDIREHVHNDFSVEPVSWVNVRTGEERALNELLPELKDKNLCAVAGIGQPEKFFNSLSSLGLSFTKSAKVDHANYSREDFKESKFDGFLMTAKDAVKCKEIAPDNSWFLKVEALLPDEFKQMFLEDVQLLMLEYSS